MRRPGTRRALAAGIAALTVFAACAGPSGPEYEPVDESERRAYQAAKALIESDPDAAERGFQYFVRSYPNSPLAPRAEIHIGEIALERGDREAALTRYYGVLNRYPNAEVSNALRVRIAGMELAGGSPEAATKVLARARLSRLSDDAKRSAYRTLASAAPDPVAQLRWLARLRTLEPDAAALTGIDGEIDSLIAQLDEANVDRAIDQIGREIPAARLQLRRAMLALMAGDIERAEAAWERAGELPQAPGTERLYELAGERIVARRAGPGDVLALPTFAEVMERPMPSTAGATGALGVVLPLSGAFAHFGEEALKGILLAAGVFDEPSGSLAGADVRLVIRDSQGRPERAAAAVRELAQDDDLSAIIGPLLKGECEAAAVAAEIAGIPLIALTTRPEVAQGRSHVFRVRTQPNQETQVLVDHAINAVGAQRFAILYPRDAYGRGLRALFWDEVENRGGSIVGVASYDPDATDFAEPIRRLVGYELLDEEVETLIEEREDMLRRARRLPAEEAMQLREEARALVTEAGEPLPPFVDFDALFIPESHEKVVLIAPQLAFHEAGGSQLLGAGGWYDANLVKIARHHVADALFTAHYYADSPLPFVQQFTQRYLTAFGSEPGAIGAQAFDAANLAIVQLANGMDSRDDVRDGLLAIRAYPGVSGVLSMSADGNANKRPFLLGVKRGRITQIN